MKNTVYVLIVLLTIVHQDFWWWESSTPLVLGFIPISLAYHACISMAAAVLWALAIKYCWPADADVTESMIAAGRDGGQA